MRASEFGGGNPAELDPHPGSGGTMRNGIISGGMRLRAGVEISRNRYEGCFHGWKPKAPISGRARVFGEEGSDWSAKSTYRITCGRPNQKHVSAIAGEPSFG